MTASQTLHFPPSGAESWREPVSTATALPATGQLGEGRIAQDTGLIYGWDGSAWVTPSGGGGGSGTVTTVSVATANGFAGTVANATTTPALTVSTSITGLLKGNGTAISAASSATDYAPGTGALATGILKSTTSTGALSIATGADMPGPTVSSKSGAFSAVAGNTYLLSGSNYAITLPDATTTTQPIEFIVTSNPIALSGPITFTFVSAQTCDGFSTYGLYTKHERIRLYSDGANWVSAFHRTDTGTLSDLTFTFPTDAYGTGVGTITSYYRRIGSTSMESWGSFTVGTVSTGKIRIVLPSTVRIDSASYVSAHGSETDGSISSLASASQQISPAGFTGYPFYDGSTTDTVFFAYRTTSLDYEKPGGSSLLAANTAIPYRFVITVSGWRP